MTQLIEYLFSEHVAKTCVCDYSWRFGEETGEGGVYWEELCVRPSPLWLSFCLAIALKAKSFADILYPEIMPKNSATNSRSSPSSS